MDKVKVECSRKWCSFKESYSSLQLARMAVEDHKAETSGHKLGAHEAAIVQKTPRGSWRSLTSRRPRHLRG
jgi:hypothetical protein